MTKKYVLNVTSLIVNNVKERMFVKFVLIWVLIINFLLVRKNVNQFVMTIVKNVLPQEFVNLVKMDFQRIIKENV